MIVLGIDPGSQVTGFGCIRDDTARIGGGTLIEAGVIRLPRAAPLAARLEELYADVTALIARHTPALIAIEAIFTHADRPASVIVMGHARGVILLACTQSRVRVIEVRPAEVKKAITGNGQASKLQVQRSVMRELGLTAPLRPLDATDALAIALCASRRRATATLGRSPRPTGNAGLRG
jgi:crossover junction endodeoxyribonuclease RuvC